MDCGCRIEMLIQDVGDAYKPVLAPCDVSHADATDLKADRLTEDQINDRAEILLTAYACQRCERSALDCDAAGDPRWFIDTDVAQPEEQEMAVIFCPACW